MTDIAFTGANSVATNTASQTLTIPGTVIPGDVMVLFFTYATGGTTVTAPSGWTPIGSNTSGSQSVRGWWRVADSGYGAGSTATVVINTAAKTSLSFASYSNVDTTSPFLVSVEYAPGTSANSWTMPNVNPGALGWRVDFLGQRSSTPATNWTVSSGMTRRAQSFNTASGAGYSVIADSNGDKGPGSIAGVLYSNNGSATAAFAGWTLILRPAADAPPTGPVLKIWNGSAWVEKPIMIWNGSAWVEKPIKIWDGNAWVG